MSDTARPGWAIYAGWIALSVLALPVGYALAFATDLTIGQFLRDTITVAGQRRITEDYLLGYFLYGMIGLTTGVLQMLVLRRVLRGARWGWWIVATLVGYMFPFMVGPLLVTQRHLGPLWEIDRVRGFITLGVIGTGIGIAQWVALRNSVRRAGWWIPITVAGWALAGLIGGVDLSDFVDVLSLALLPPATSAAALWLLLAVLPGSDGAAPVRTSSTPVS